MEDVTGGSTETYSLTGLQSGQTYNMFVMATSSDYPPSILVNLQTLLGK